ncbi:MAG: hypothetical protein U5L08_07745 [Xanthomonadales bacterium]|nr:hypothetical protein [Xanthomonadales bacterium]
MDQEFEDSAASAPEMDAQLTDEREDTTSPELSESIVARHGAEDEVSECPGLDSVRDEGAPDPLKNRSSTDADGRTMESAAGEPRFPDESAVSLTDAELDAIVDSSPVWSLEDEEMEGFDEESPGFESDAGPAVEDLEEELEPWEAFGDIPDVPMDSFVNEESLGFESDAGPAAEDLEEELEPWEAFGDIPDVPMDSFVDEEDGWQDEPSKRQRLSREEDVRRFAMQIARDVDGARMDWRCSSGSCNLIARSDASAGICDSSFPSARSAWKISNSAPVFARSAADRGYRRGWVFQLDGGGARAVDWKNNLDWWTALDLIRMLQTDDEDEVRLFLECAFEDWVRLSARCSNADLMLMDSRSLERSAMMNFHGYLQLVLARMKRQSSSGADRMPPHLDQQLFP